MISFLTYAYQIVVFILSLFCLFYVSFASIAVNSLLLGAYSLILLFSLAKPWLISIDWGCILNYSSNKRDDVNESPSSLSFNSCIIIKSLIYTIDYFLPLDSSSFNSLLSADFLLGESLLVPMKLVELFTDVIARLAIDLVCEVNLSLFLSDFGTILLYFLQSFAISVLILIVLVRVELPSCDFKEWIFSNNSFDSLF